MLPTDDGCCGSPVTECDPPEAVAYSYTVWAGWLEEPAPGLGTMLFLGVPLGGGSGLSGQITPAPTQLFVETAVAIPVGPVSSPPLPGEIPGSWQVVSDWIEEQLNPLVGFALPASFVPPSFSGPMWIRVRLRDEHGCITTAYAYFPGGFGDPGAWPIELTAFVKVGSLGFEEATFSDAPPPILEEQFEVADETGICPPPEKAVRVVPGCNGFPVEAELTIPEGGMPVVAADEDGLHVTGEITGPAGGPVEVQSPDGDPLLVSTPLQIAPGSGWGEEIGAPNPTTATIVTTPGALSYVVTAHQALGGTLVDPATFVEANLTGVPHHVQINGPALIFPALPLGKLYPALTVYGEIGGSDSQISIRVSGLYP